MSLLFYEQKFSHLNPNRSGGEPSPHKVAMLLAVMAIIEDGQLEVNRIPFNKELRDQFSHQFNQLKNDRDKNNPHLPFFYLKSSGFWHHQPKPGENQIMKY